MMAFFDSLVQRELEGWSTDDMGDSDGEIYGGFAHTVQSSSPASNISRSGDEGGFSPFTIAFASVMARQELLESQEDGSNPPHNLLDLDLHCPERVSGSETPTPAEHSGREESDRDPAVPEEPEASVSDNAPSTSEEHSTSHAEPAAEANDASSPRNLESFDAAEASSSTVQDSQASRRSISSLIAQKRKEYLAAVRRAEKRSQTKRKPKHTWSSLKRKKRLKVRHSCVREDDSSTSDSSDYGGLNARFSSDEDSSHLSVDGDQVNTEEQIENIQAAHRKKTLDLKRLKNLRCRVMKSDSDSDSEIPNKNCLSKIQSNTCVKVSIACKEGHNSDKGEVGPHLSEAHYDSRSSGVSASGVGSTVGEGSAVNVDCACVRPSTSQHQPDPSHAESNSKFNRTLTGMTESLNSSEPDNESTRRNVNNAFKSHKSNKRNYRKQQKKHSSDED